MPRPPNRFWPAQIGCARRRRGHGHAGSNGRDRRNRAHCGSALVETTAVSRDMTIPPMASTGIADLVRRIKLRADAVGLRCLLHPPVSPGRLAQLAERFGSLPDELTELLRETAALELGGSTIAFAEDVALASLPECNPWALVPKSLALSQERNGDAVLVDLGQKSAGARSAPVLALLQRPAVLAYLAPGLSDFLQSAGVGLPRSREEIRDDWQPLAAIVATSRQRRRQVAGEVAPVSRQEALARSDDPVLKDWALSLPARARIVDFRAAGPGASFRWGFPARPIEFWRHPSELLFGWLPNPKPRSIWGFVTGFDEAGEHRRAARLIRTGNVWRTRSPG